MTLPAVDTWNVVGLEGPKYTVGPRCSNPQCSRIAEHAHHIVRRSALGGAYDWVSIDGYVVANKTGLCPQCHDGITGRIGGHTDAIRFVDNVFLWCSVHTDLHDTVEYLEVGPLEPQPPTPESLAERAPGLLEESDSCPFCGHKNRRRRGTSTHPRRRRKTWTVQVPNDEEDGAEVLDTLVDELAPLLGIDATATGRYFVLVPTLVYAHHHRENLLESLKGHGG